MTPDASKHNPDPDYLRELIARAGLSQVTAAKTIGIAPRTMRGYLDPDDSRKAPYPVQYCLELLAAGSAWLPEIMTGKRVLIEPPARAGYPDHIDIVFDDATDSPFSICLDRTRQVDRVLSDGDAMIIIYPGSLDDPIELPCTIRPGRK